MDFTKMDIATMDSSTTLHAKMDIATIDSATFDSAT